MTKHKTPFYIAAERFACGTNKYGCCGEIDDVISGDVLIGYTDESRWFERLFEPSEKEKKKFSSQNAYWMTSSDRTPEQNRQDRVIALLLADIIWRE